MKPKTSLEVSTAPSEDVVDRQEQERTISMTDGPTFNSSSSEEELGAEVNEFLNDMAVVHVAWLDKKNKMTPGHRRLTKTVQPASLTQSRQPGTTSRTTAAITAAMLRSLGGCKNRMNFRRKKDCQDEKNNSNDNNSSHDTISTPVVDENVLTLSSSPLVVVPLKTTSGEGMTFCQLADTVRTSYSWAQSCMMMGYGCGGDNTIDVVADDDNILDDEQLRGPSLSYPSDKIDLHPCHSNNYDNGVTDTILCNQIHPWPIHENEEVVVVLEADTAQNSHTSEESSTAHLGFDGVTELQQTQTVDKPLVSQKSFVPFNKKELRRLFSTLRKGKDEITNVQKKKTTTTMRVMKNQTTSSERRMRVPNTVTSKRSGERKKTKSTSTAKTRNVNALPQTTLKEDSRKSLSDSRSNDKTPSKRNSPKKRDRTEVLLPKGEGTTIRHEFRSTRKALSDSRRNDKTPSKRNPPKKRDRTYVLLPTVMRRHATNKKKKKWLLGHREGDRDHRLELDRSSCVGDSKTIGIEI